MTYATAEPEPSPIVLPGAVERATVLANDAGRLVEALASAPEVELDPAIQVLDRDVGLLDVQDTVTAWLRQDFFLERENLPPLALEDNDGLVPVLYCAIDEPDVVGGYRYAQRNRQYLSAPREVVQQSFFERLRRFVTVRLGRSELSREPRTDVARDAGPGTLVEARCAQFGLHVYYSMLFVREDFRARRVFGSRLTSPVQQHLPDGIWSFGLARAGDPVRWQPHEVSVPDVTAVDLDPL